MTRQEANIAIYYILVAKEVFTDILGYEKGIEVADELRELIEQYPQQRFGQIFTNYIYPEYRERTSSSLNMLMDILFYGVDMDPFYEESTETYNRLK